MNIRNRKQLRNFAAQRLENAPHTGKILLIFIGITIGLSALTTALNYALGLAISNSGGLGSMGKRTVLSTIQSMLPLATTMINLCLEVGLMSAMLRTARGQYASPQGLNLGFDRFWVLLRCTIIKGLILTGVIFSSVYVGIMLFMVTPLSRPAVELLMPYLEEVSMLNPELVLPEELYAQFARAILPAYAICGLLLLVCVVPVLYAYRMDMYLIIDNPAMGAMAALRRSKTIMKGNKRALLLLDLSLWPYYLALLLAQVVCYGDMLLPLVGVNLPGNADVWFFVFMGLYLALDGAICYYFRGRLEVIYALAYDAIKPPEPQNQGVVLGNIFQM